MAAAGISLLLRHSRLYLLHLRYALLRSETWSSMLVRQSIRQSPRPQPAPGLAGIDCLRPSGVFFGEVEFLVAAILRLPGLAHSHARVIGCFADRLSARGRSTQRFLGGSADRVERGCCSRVTRAIQCKT
jgi:hypothetical protein